MKLRTGLILSIVACLFSGCKFLPEVSEVMLSESSITLQVNQSKTITATVEPAAAEYESITWSSSDPSVASVSSNGRIVAMKIGTAEITASAAGVTSKPCKVTVISQEENITIPDAAFKSYLVSKYDTNNDGEISKTEALKITYLNVSDSGISSLLGIETMENLTNLMCESNQLTSLDVSKNTKLTYLSCSSNQLTSLDVTKNTALINLNCKNNQLTSLDVSKNTALTYLDCFSNRLTSLDVSKNTALINLNCEYNQLTSLDVTKNTALTQLFCYNNKLTSLDVTKNTALTRLDCRSNQITTLDVSRNTQLTYLDCNPMNYNSLQSLYMATGQSISTLNVPSYTKIVRK